MYVIRCRVEYHVHCSSFLFSQSSLFGALPHWVRTEYGFAHWRVNIRVIKSFIKMNKRDRMIACEMIRQDFVKTGKYRNWRNHSQELQCETALDVKELFDSRLPKVINKVICQIVFKTSSCDKYIFFFHRSFFPNYPYPLLCGGRNILTEIHHILSVVMNYDGLRKCSNVWLWILL